MVDAADRLSRARALAQLYVVAPYADQRRILQALLTELVPSFGPPSEDELGQVRVGAGEHEDSFSSLDVGMLGDVPSVDAPALYRYLTQLAESYPAGGAEASALRYARDRIQRAVSQASEPR